MKKRVFIIHGFQGRPEGGWKPWVKHELEERGFDVFVPSMPDPDHPNKDDWVAKIRETIGEPLGTDVIIGHSLGTIATLRYLESMKPGQTVGKVILVAGFYEDLGDDEMKDMMTFVDTPVDWDAVHAHCPRFEVIHSDDDSSVPTRFAQRLANQLKVPIDMHQGYGHFSSGDAILELHLLIPKIYL